MGALSEKLRFGVLKVSTDAGPMYTRPSIWERLYLLWTFRNFRRLPQQVLNLNQRRLVEKLCATAVMRQRDMAVETRIIGVVENVHFDAQRNLEAGRRSGKLIEMPANAARVAILQAAGSEGLPIPSSSQPCQPNVAGPSARRPLTLQDFAPPPSLDRNLSSLLEPLRRNLHRLRAQDWRKWGPPALLSAAALALLVSLLVSARNAPRTVATTPLSKTAASQVEPKVKAANTAVISPRPSAARAVGQLQTPATPMRVAAAINTLPLTAETAPQPRPATNTASPVSSPGIAQAPAVMAARQPPVGTIASREEENTNATSAIAREVVPAATRPAPPERVVIAAAPQSFSYPIAPSPKLTGKVSLKVFIAADGSVREAKVISGSPALTDAAVRAVRNWRYRPAELNGRAAEAETKVTINFAGDDAVTIAFR
jgi:periplasmic protein TonB